MSGFWVREMSKVFEALERKKKFKWARSVVSYGSSSTVLEAFFSLVGMTFFLEGGWVCGIMAGFGGKKKNFSKGVIYCLWEMGNGQEGGFSIRMLKFDDVSEG